MHSSNAQFFTCGAAKILSFRCAPVNEQVIELGPVDCRL